jgi:hypothetical protein
VFGCNDIQDEEAEEKAKKDADVAVRNQYRYR